MSDTEATLQAFFEPDTVLVLGAAYECALGRLGEAPEDSDAPAHVIRREIARQIVALAKTGERDRDRLCDFALSECRRQMRLGALEPTRSRKPASDPKP
jgi:hypothetical protein